MNYDASNLDGFSISEGLLQYMINTVPPGSVILELGSGAGTGELIKLYSVYSIEDNLEYIDKYKSNYIYAPTKDEWYDTDKIKAGVPSEYDVLLIDGPTGSVQRLGFLDNTDIFNLDVLIIVDDVHREAEMSIANHLSKVTGRQLHLSDGSLEKRFAAIPTK